MQSLGNQASKRIGESIPCAAKSVTTALSDSTAASMEGYPDVADWRNAAVSASYSL